MLRTSLGGVEDPQDLTDHILDRFEKSAAIDALLSLGPSCAKEIGAALLAIIGGYPDYLPEGERFQRAGPALDDAPAEQWDQWAEHFEGVLDFFERGIVPEGDGAVREHERWVGDARRWVDSCRMIAQVQRRYGYIKDTDKFIESKEAPETWLIRELGSCLEPLGERWGLVSGLASDFTGVHVDRATCQNRIGQQRSKAAERAKLKLITQKPNTDESG